MRNRLVLLLTTAAMMVVGADAYLAVASTSSGSSAVSDRGGDLQLSSHQSSGHLGDGSIVKEARKAARDGESKARSAHDAQASSKQSAQSHHSSHTSTSKSAAAKHGSTTKNSAASKTKATNHKAESHKAQSHKAEPRKAKQEAKKKPITYVVKPGDNLSSIAQWFHLHGYGALYQWNRKVIGGNPNLIFPGERITVSASGNKMSH